MTMTTAEACPQCGHHLSARLESHIDKKLRLNASKMLAQHLVFSLQIQPGKNLILLLGRTGRETDNFDALASWVEGNLDHINQWPLPSSDAVRLIESMEKELRSILQDISYGWS